MVIDKVMDFGIGKIFSGAAKAVSGVVKGVAKAVKSVAKSPIGRAALTIGAAMFLGPGAFGFSGLGLTVVFNLVLQLQELMQDYKN
jgi:hypothetical protein